MIHLSRRTRTIARRLLGAVTALAVLCCVLACGATQKVREAADRAKRSNDLKMLGLSYLNYNDDKKSGPPDQQAWLQWSQQKEGPEAAAVIQKAGQGGQYTILFGHAFPKDFPQGASNTVLGYENQASPQGRLVLFGDGSVRMVSEAEFAGLPRPTGAKK
jgi:hypothetical protein